MLVVPVVISMLFGSLSGAIVNVFLFWKFVSKSGTKSAFLKLCIAKTVPNSVVCFVFLFWVTPLTALSVPYLNIPVSVNRIVGQLTGFGAYVAGPLIQLFMALNRCSVLFFPLKTMTMDGSRNTNIAIVIVVIVAALFAGVGLFHPSCGFVYDPQLFRWNSEETECANLMALVLFFTVIGLTTVSNALNMITFLKLCFDKTEGLNNEAIVRRRRQRIRLFTQSAIQDCLHVFDMINFNIIAPLSTDPLFQLVFISMSLLMIHTLDGFVMLLFHSEIASGSTSTSTKAISVVPSQPNF